MTGSERTQYYGMTACGQTFLDLMRRYLPGPTYYALKRRHPFG
jgi:hypothetical protein